MAALPASDRFVYAPATLPVQSAVTYQVSVAVLATVPGRPLTVPPATEVQVLSRGMGAELIWPQPVLPVAGTLHVLPLQLVRVVMVPPPVHVAEAATVLQPVVLHM